MVRRELFSVCRAVRAEIFPLTPLVARRSSGASADAVVPSPHDTGLSLGVRTPARREIVDTVCQEKGEDAA